MPSPSILNAPVATALTFPQAIQAIIDGKKITKLEWGGPDTFGVLKDGILMIYRNAGSKLASEIAADYEFHSWIISSGDLSGTDWIILD